MIGVVVAAARAAPRSEPANSHDFDRGRRLIPHPSSNGGKQRFLIVVVDATLSIARQIGFEPFIFKITGADLVGRTAHPCRRAICRP